MKILRIVILAFLAALTLPVVQVRANITSTTARVGPYTIASFPATLSVTFPYQQSSDLLVLNMGAAGSNAAPVILTLNSDYTVTGGGYNANWSMLSGNAVVIATGSHLVAVGDRITILRNVPVNQGVSFITGVLTAKAIETGFDKAATISQQLTETSTRTLRFPAGETGDGTLPLASRAGKILGFTNAGAPAYFDPASSSYVNGGGVTVGTITTLRALSVAGYTTGQQAVVAGYYSSNDGGGGLFVYDSGSAATDNGGTIIAPNSGTGRWLRSYIKGRIEAKWFGVAADDLTDDLNELNAAILALNDDGGGNLILPSGTILISTTWQIGDGTNSAQSTYGNRIVIQGEGYGTGPEVANTQINGSTRIRYTGATSTSAAVVSFAGPLHSMGLSGVMLDADDKAGIGVSIIHLTQSTFQRVAVRGYTTTGWNLTSRSGFPTGCAYGNADNRFYDCYGFDPSNTTATGVSLSSGVSFAATLAGAPDSARNIFIGGTFAYGGDASSYGAFLQGADNNQFIGTFFLPSGGSAGGYDVYFEQWPASGDFPKENVFTNCGMTRGASGNGGTGPSGGNFFWPYQTGDGAPVPAFGTVQAMTQDGRTYINGVRAYRGRQIQSLELQTARTTTSATFVNITGYSISIVTKAATKLNVRFTGSATIATAGTGYFIISVNGLEQGPTQSAVGATTFYSTIAGECVVDVGAGTQTVVLRFLSSSGNTVTLDRACLIVEELY